MNDLAASTGEKTVLGRFVRMSIEGEGTVGAYVHSNGKLAVLVEVLTDKAADENMADFAKNVAMQIAAANPPGSRRLQPRPRPSWNAQRERVPPEGPCRRQARKGSSTRSPKAP